MALNRCSNCIVSTTHHQHGFVIMCTPHDGPSALHGLPPVRQQLWHHVSCNGKTAVPGCAFSSTAAGLAHKLNRYRAQSAHPGTTLQDLVKRYEAKDQKCDELRSKFTATKIALSNRERELEAAQRVLQKSSAEKNTLKVMQ
jgi:hypothetical protein